jgi:LuxR family transcriptional regulator, maltose regulon positive regulatory protein
MPDTLLRTKFTVPPYRSGLISRTRLIANLKAGFDSGVRLILISAPAGSGKSILATEWAAQSLADKVTSTEQPTIRFAWLSIDSTDNQHLQFWFCLISALQVVLPDLGQTECRILSFPEAPPVTSILTGLLNQIGTRSERIVLVLDDYHLIVEPSIHEGITFILENMPVNMQIVIATRADPPLPLSRMRVRNQLLEIRAADLFFTLPESEMLINDVMGLGLSAGDLAMLEERTEGWAAGVQLASVLLMDERRKADTGQIGERLSALVTRLSGRQHLIADYLLDEVLSRQSKEVQRFLLDSSILDELCAPLCDALTENEDGSQNTQAILEYLEHTNLFFIPLDEEHTWFRYHHLFADALRIRLERTRPGAINILHLRASRWYESNGQAEKAIEHALAAQDYERTAALIEANVKTFARQGRFAPMLNWLNEIPAQTILPHPILSIWGSQALALSGKLSAAEQQLQALEAAYESAPALLTSELRGRIAAVRATAAILNADTNLAKEQSQKAIDLLPHGDSTLAAVMLAFGNAALMSGEIPKGIQQLRESITMCQQNNDLSTMLTAFSHLSAGLRMQGRLRQEEAVCLEALDEVNSQLGAGDWPLPTLALIYGRLGGIRKEWNDLAGAEQALTRAVRIAENSTYLSAVVNAYGGLAALRRSQGNISGAIDLVEKCIQAIHRRESILYLDMCLALRAYYWARAGNLTAAHRWVEERKLSAERAIDYVGEGELLALAYLWIADGRADEAETIAGRLVAFAETKGQFGSMIGYLVLQALAHRGAGRLDLAVQSIERAIVMGEPGGYTQTFLDEGDALLDLLQRIARGKSHASAYARLLLSKMEMTITQEQDHSSSIPAKTRLIEPLTGRELAVLRQMATGSSNQEIAQRMVISVGTVKAHIFNITAKLGARSRTEAVARAREAGLLP